MHTNTVVIDMHWLTHEVLRQGELFSVIHTFVGSLVSTFEQLLLHVGVWPVQLGS